MFAGTALLCCILPALARQLEAGKDAGKKVGANRPGTTSAAKALQGATPASTGPLKPYTEVLPVSAVKLEMMPIPAGSINIRGKVVPIKPFWIANTETAWETFDTFLASGPASKAYDQTQFPPDAVARPSKSYILPDLGWGHHGYPAINVSILSVTMFCRWLSATTGKKYRLPTEAEWEYAARAGKAAEKLTAAQLDKVAWYAANSDKKSHPVGKKLPNAWKLYDMYGNVGEWATDLEGKPVLCGSTFLEEMPKAATLTMRQYQIPAWQETDPQLPKSRWWLSDGKFIGFRVVCEP